MAMIWFNGVPDPSSSTRDTLSLQLIKEKTGVVITEGGSNSYNVYDATIQFPDMSEPASIMFHDSIGTCLIFVDAENHFFASVNERAMTGSPPQSGNSINWLNNLICEKEDGEFLSIAERTSGSREMYRAFNIPYYAREDSTKDKMTILPAYYASPQTSIRYGYIKNTYIQYERTYQPGLRLVDEKGRKFVTLGTYLLYQTE